MKADALTITVTGPQGAGKTQIAQKLAYALKKEGIKHTLHDVDGADVPENREGILITTCQVFPPGEGPQPGPATEPSAPADIRMPHSDQLISDEELEQLLADRPERSVTKKLIDSRIFSTSWTKLTETMIVCVIKMENGYSVIGKAACAHPDNFDEAIGKKVSFEDAFSQIWALEGYLLKEALYREHLRESTVGKIGTDKPAKSATGKKKSAA